MAIAAETTRKSAFALEEDLGWMLGVTFRSYVKAADTVLRDLPGGPRGYQVMAAALRDAGGNQGAIAEELGIDRTVLTYLIDDLERLGLVVRRPDPADRRSRILVATDQGRSVLQQRQELLRQAESQLLSTLAPSEAARFKKLLQKVACGAKALGPIVSLCEVAQQVTPLRPAEME